MIDADVLTAGLQVITGGLGGLGLVAARQLAELGATSVLLTSSGSAGGHTAQRDLRQASAHCDSRY